MLPSFRAHLADDGELLLSGLLTSDRPEMEAALREHGLTIDDERTDNGWWAVRCTRAS
jgi:ribosomal protein L11 methyltransferase